MPPPTFQTWFTDTIGLIKQISGILSALATIGLLIVAFIGLRQWSTELKGRVELETARAILKNLLVVKYVFIECRRSAIFPTEFSDRNLGPDETQMEKAALDEEHAYWKRMNHLTAAVLEFETAAVEAEVLWGNEAVAARNNVNSLHNSLAKAYTAYFPGSIRDAKLEKDTHEDWGKANRQVLFTPVGEDEFGTAAKETFEKAERTFRKYLLGNQKISKTSNAKGERA